MNLPELVPVGISASQSLRVTHDLTVQARVPDLPPVYSTPNMILFMEIVCTDLIRPCLPPGWVSVGALVEVKHLAATPVGFTVTVRATVVEVTKSLVVFEVEAHDGVDRIGSGRHARAPIELARFLAGTERKRAAHT
ncbi:MAG TPA: hotdog domain-containing protein [Gammaproteobacteria bacterium]|nr:hotdog domain-containing protein [Gammaproteobacteria bacterium]